MEEWSESRCSDSNSPVRTAAGPSAQMAPGQSLFLYERGQDKLFRSIQHDLDNTPYFTVNDGDQALWSRSNCYCFSAFRFSYWFRCIVPSLFSAPPPDRHTPIIIPLWVLDGIHNTIDATTSHTRPSTIIHWLTMWSPNKNPHWYDSHCGEDGRLNELIKVASRKAHCLTFLISLFTFSESNSDPPQMAISKKTK